MVAASNSASPDPGARRLCLVDLHVHSSASADSDAAPAEIAARARQLGLAPLFLTDHDTISGAEKLITAGTSRVITAEEISTTAGHLIGLFLTGVVDGGLSPEETVAAIRAQGGLVMLAHPFDRRRPSLNEEAIERIADKVDIVEVFNARSEALSNDRARQLCHLLGAAPGAGSDAHHVHDVGAAYVEMEEFSGPDDFLAKLRRGRRLLRRTGWRRPFGRPELLR